MKIRLEMEMNDDSDDGEGNIKSLDEIREDLRAMLFDVCEDWVLRGNKPDLEFLR